MYNVLEAQSLHGLYVQVQIQVVTQPHGHHDVEDKVGPATPSPRRQNQALATASLPVKPLQLHQPETDSKMYNGSMMYTIQYNTIRYDTIRYDTIPYSTIQYNTIQYNTIQYNTIQYNTIQYNTIQYNTIQYNTIQYNTIQYNTIQYNIR